MKTLALLVASLAVFGIPGVSPSGEQSPVASVPEATSAAGPSGGSAAGPVQTRIYSVRYYPASRLAAIIRTVAGGANVRVVEDDRSNLLILTAPQARVPEIELLIKQLDQPDASAAQAQNLMYRVYMLEIPAKDQTLKAFSLVLEGSSQLPSVELLDALKDKELQVAALYQEGRGRRDENWEVAIEGRAVSQEAIKRVVEKIPGCQVKQLEWNDGALVSTVPAAQVDRLPAQLQEHLRKFLGEEIQTVGYWFGSLSSPGEVRAPVGPWTLELKANSERPPDQASDLVLEIEVNRESHVPFMPRTRILSNTVQGQIGRPIIIGYNRDSYGTRTMGAVVILPEAEAARSDSPANRAR
jgi:hypothetical protein